MLNLSFTMVEENAKARLELNDFLRRNYSGASLSPRDFEISKFFWASEGLTGTRLGCTGYIRKTTGLAECVKTVVVAEARGKGVGKYLSESLEDFVRQVGYKKLSTAILTTNLPMLFIKLRQGFLIEGLCRDHDAPGVHEYHLGKVLQ